MKDSAGAQASIPPSHSLLTSGRPVLSPRKEVRGTCLSSDNHRMYLVFSPFRARKWVFILCGLLVAVFVLYPILAYAPTMHVPLVVRSPAKPRFSPAATLRSQDFTLRTLAPRLRSPAGKLVSEVGPVPPALPLRLVSAPVSSTSAPAVTASNLLPSINSSQQRPLPSSLSSTSSKSFQKRLPWRTANETSVNGTTKIICLTFTGRLGNEMFEYAGILGLAMTLKLAPVVINSEFLVKALKTFPYAAGNDSRLLERCRNATAAYENGGSKYTEALTRLDPTKDYKIGLYFQSFRYFLPHWPQVRDALTFSDAVLNETNHVVRQLREKYSSPPTIMIGVHIRRGDMAFDYNVKLGYPLASQGYINRSLSYYQNLFPGQRCVFVVASDSIKWCKANFPVEYHVHFLESRRSPEVDMMTLVAMDHVIISFGSFSWWIGFLNPGHTVYMKDFLVNGTQISKTFYPEGRDYIYPGWIPL